MMERFDKLPPSGLWEAAAAAAGLLLALYPGQAGNILVKAVSALGIFYALYRLLHFLIAGGLSAGRVKLPALSAAGMIFSLLFFFRPPLFWLFILLAAGAALVLYGVLRIPMIWEVWAMGLGQRLSALAWVVLPLAVGALLLFRPIEAAAVLLFRPIEAAAVLLRLSGILLLLFGLAALLAPGSEKT